MGSQIFRFLGQVGVLHEILTARKEFKIGRFSVKKSESCCLLNLTISSH